MNEEGIPVSVGRSIARYTSTISTHIGPWPMG